MAGGAGCVGGQEKEWMGCFLDDLRAFGINADQWTTAAQDEGEWRRSAEQGAEHFMAKWIASENTKARLRHAVVCPSVTGRTKERIAQNKRARAGSLALVDYCTGIDKCAHFQEVSRAITACFTITQSISWYSTCNN